MRPLRTAQDIRTAPRRLACHGPFTEQRAYGLLTGLARERQRLLSQQQSWQRRLVRISRSLAEIDAQAARLHGRLPGTAGGREVLRRGPSWRRPSSVTDQPC
jgi:hypothetical protein